MSHHAHTRSKTATVLGAATGLTTAVLALVSCSASPPHPAHQHGAPAAGKASTAAAHPPGTSAPATGTSTGQLGATLPVSDSSGTQLDITLTKVVDPASGANQYTSPAKGNHFAGVKFAIRNTATATYQNNANNETTIILTNGKTLHADYNPIAGCSNFDNGQITLKGGATGTGCITFQIPKGQKVAEVGYGNTTFPGRNAEWQVP
jgi:Domain of unknown function (DUF4352)